MDAPSSVVVASLHFAALLITNNLRMMYPENSNTFPIDLQLFYGPSLLINPKTDENVTNLTFYLRNDKFYDLATQLLFPSDGSNTILLIVSITDIPTYIRGSSILPMGAQGTNTTISLRKIDFELIIAPGRYDKASGDFYIDDGDFSSE